MRNDALDDQLDAELNTPEPKDPALVDLGDDEDDERDGENVVTVDAEDEPLDVVDEMDVNDDEESEDDDAADLAEDADVIAGDSPPPSGGKPQRGSAALDVTATHHFC